MNSKLNSNFCEDITAFKDYLRFSRSLVDDTITQNLNNLVLPARFDPASTSRVEKRQLRTPIDKSSCNTLLETIFENWDARTSTIETCLSRAATTTTSSSSSTASLPPYQRHQPTEEEVRARRLDPYAARNMEPEESMLKRVSEQELGTERIIRDRTWRVIRGRCDDLTGMSEDWQSAFNAWRSRKVVST